MTLASITGLITQAESPGIPARDGQLIAVRSHLLLIVVNLEKQYGSHGACWKPDQESIKESPKQGPLRAMLTQKSRMEQPLTCREAAKLFV